MGMKKYLLLLLSVPLYFLWAEGRKEPEMAPKQEMTAKVQELDPEDLPKSEAEWKKILTPDQYYILRRKGTERPFTGKLLKEKRSGVYTCAGCGTPLFSSEHKFDSGTGWPSFYQPINPEAVKEIRDFSHGMVRTEVVTAKCGGHLGHVFADGPRPTGLRYCINSLALNFVPDESENEKN